MCVHRPVLANPDSRAYFSSVFLPPGLGNVYCDDPSGVSSGFCGGIGTNGGGALCDDGCAAGNDLCVSGKQLTSRATS